MIVIVFMTGPSGGFNPKRAEFTDQRDGKFAKRRLVSHKCPMSADIFSHRFPAACAPFRESVPGVADALAGHILLATSVPGWPTPQLET